MKCKQMTAYKWQYNPWSPKCQVVLKVLLGYKMGFRTSLLCLRFFRMFLHHQNIGHLHDYLNLVTLVVNDTKYMSFFDVSEKIELKIKMIFLIYLIGT